MSQPSRRSSPHPRALHFLSSGGKETASYSFGGKYLRRCSLSGDGYAALLLERHGGDDLRRAARVLEGDRPVEREHPPQRQQLPRHLNRARKAVEHARHPRELANDGHRVGVGVAVVDDNREGQLLRKRHLAAQHVLLQLARGIFRPVVVQPDLADGDDLRPRGG